MEFFPRFSQRKAFVDANAKTKTALFSERKFIRRSKTSDALTASSDHTVTENPPPTTTTTSAEKEKEQEKEKEKEKGTIVRVI